MIFVDFVHGHIILIVDLEACEIRNLLSIRTRKLLTLVTKNEKFYTLDFSKVCCMYLPVSCICFLWYKLKL